MTMTTMSDNSPRRGDLSIDTQTLPPFVALDDLEKSIAVLDEWCSNFIGRMQPYCSGSALLAELQAPESSPSPDQSGLENRIYVMSRRVGQIRQALDSMNEGLRL